jgi:hypothetical protein
VSTISNETFNPIVSTKYIMYIASREWIVFTTAATTTAEQYFGYTILIIRQQQPSLLPTPILNTYQGHGVLDRDSSIPSKRTVRV